MDIEIIFDVDDVGVAQQLRTLSGRLGAEGLRRFMDDKVDPFLKDRAGMRFLAEGDDAVGRWLPLASSTQAMRAALGYGAAHPINVRTRDMITYMLQSQSDSRTSALGAELVYPREQMSPDIYDKIKTAQEGKAKPRTPPRPVVALSKVDQTRITTDLAEYMMQGLMGGVLP